MGGGKLGNYAKEQLTHNGINVIGFLDNAFPYGDESKGICAIDELRQKDIVVISSKAYPTIANQLKNIGISNSIYYEELANRLPSSLDNYNEAYHGIWEEIERNKNRYIWLYNLLQDSVSKQVFSDMIWFRMTYNAEYCAHARGLSLQCGVQDFDDCITRGFSSDTVFCDVGGYDGKTTEDFLKLCPEYKQIYFFEPDIESYETAKKKLDGYRDITYYNSGVGSVDGTARFESIGGNSGRISDSGSIEVPVMTLEKFITEKTYVKMDIEGAEHDALLGMEKQISEFKPMLGISVYHKPGDIHSLASYILTKNPEYRLYLRHYKYNLADTICYFV